MDNPKKFPVREPISFTMTIESLSRGGAGLGKGPDQRVVFVPYTAPGDKVEVVVEKREKRYDFAKVIRVIEASSARVSPKCEIFEKCGGCQWQHLPYDLQWKTKSEGTRHALARAGVEVKDLTASEWTLFPSDTPYHYRNRVQLREKQGQYGFFERASRQLVALPASGCAVARDEINSELAQLRVPPQLAMDSQGFRKIEIEVDSDGTTHKTWNARHAARGFRQVHDSQNQKMTDWVTALVKTRMQKWTGAEVHLLDLYGGAGNLSKALWDSADSVDVVDIWAPVDFEKHQSERREGERVRFYNESVDKWLAKRSRDYRRGYGKKAGFRLAILDPPREGLEPASRILDALLEMEVNELVFIHCDADSHARDVKKAFDRGFFWNSGAVFDFFPQTPHVETAAHLVFS